MSWMSELRYKMNQDRRQQYLIDSGQVPGLGSGYTANPNWNGQIPGSVSAQIPGLWQSFSPSNQSTIQMIYSRMNQPIQQTQPTIRRDRSGNIIGG